ncbi:MAG: hypothetical protein M1837_003600 [Sclerophora amabilis]|nr:MAG: hypothetical protein M1837_003600 [Sclerophora amabilis]
MASSIANVQKPGNRKVTDFFKRYASSHDDERSKDADLGKLASPAPPAQIPRPRPSEEFYQGFQQPSKTNRIFSPDDPSTRENIRDKQDEDLFRGQCDAPSELHNTRGQRVVKNGVVMIKSSDDEEADSDTSLEDIDSLLAMPNSAKTSSKRRHSGDPSNALASPPSTRSRTGKNLGRSIGESLATPLPGLPKYRFSLASLVDQTAKDQASEVGVAQAREILEPGKVGGTRGDTDDKDISEEGSGNLDVEKSRAVDQGLLETVVGDEDEGEMDRIMTAMMRTEALSRSKTWSFFQNLQENATTPENVFPTSCLPGSGWQELLRDSRSRQEAFLCGFVGEMSSRKCPLPADINLWMMDELSREPREDLRFAYVSTLKVSASRLNNILSPTWLSQTFVALQGSEEAVDLKQAILPVPPADTVPQPYRSKLLSVLDLLAGAAPFLTRESREHAICLLLRILLDTNITESIDLLLGLENTIVSLFNTIEEEFWEHYLHAVGTTVVGYTGDSAFREQLLKYMPVHTPRLHEFRHRLALVYFLDDPSFLEGRQLDGLSNIGRITVQLDRPQFEITNRTDYTELAALTSILDISIDDGGGGISTSDIRDRKDIETAFNRAIDTLARKIKTMFTKIIDTGASHMTRTEAKENLDRVYVRLTHAIRTKLKTKQDIFQSRLTDAGTAEHKASAFSRLTSKPKS